MGGNWGRGLEGEAGRAAGLTPREGEREGRVVRRKHLRPQCSLERRQRLLGSPPASVPDRRLKSPSPWLGAAHGKQALGKGGALDLPAQQLGPLVTQEGQRSASLK